MFLKNKPNKPNLSDQDQQQQSPPRKTRPQIKSESTGESPTTTTTDETHQQLELSQTNDVVINNTHHYDSDDSGDKVETVNELWISNRYTLQNQLVELLLSLSSSSFSSSSQSQSQSQSQVSPSPSSSSTNQASREDVKCLYICNSESFAFSCMRAIQRQLKRKSRLDHHHVVVQCTTLFSLDDHRYSSINMSTTTTTNEDNDDDGESDGGGGSESGGWGESIIPSFHQMMVNDCFFTTASHVLLWLNNDRLLFELSDFDWIVFDEMVEIKSDGAAVNDNVALLLKKMEQVERQRGYPFSVISMSSNLFSQYSECKQLPNGSSSASSSSGSYVDSNVRPTLNLIKYVKKRVLNREGVDNSCLVKFFEPLVFGQTWSDRYIDIELPNDEKKDYVYYLGVGQQSMQKSQATLMEMILGLYREIQKFVSEKFGSGALETIIPRDYLLGSCEMSDWLSDIQQYCIATRSTSMWLCIQKIYECHIAYRMIQEEIRGWKQSVVEYLTLCANRTLDRLAHRSSASQQVILSESWTGVTQEGIKNVYKPQSFAQFMDSSIRSSVEQDLNTILTSWISKIQSCENIQDRADEQNDLYKGLISSIDESIRSHTEDPNLQILVLVTHRRTIDRIHAHLSEQLKDKTCSIHKVKKFVPADLFVAERHASPQLILTTRFEFERMCSRSASFSNRFSFIMHYDSPSMPYYEDISCYNTKSKDNCHVYLYHIGSSVNTVLERNKSVCSLLKEDSTRSLIVTQLELSKSSVSSAGSSRGNHARKRTRDSDLSTDLDAPDTKRPKFSRFVGQTPTGREVASSSQSIPQSSSLHRPNVIAHLGEDMSSKMNQIITGVFKTTPRYVITEKTTDTKGVLHTFEATMSFYDSVGHSTWTSYGQGKNKKEAKKDAARDMYNQYLSKYPNKK